MELQDSRPRSGEAKVWDRLAGGYERTVKHFDRSYPQVCEEIRSDFADRRHVLEVAAGTGQFTFTLAEVAERVTATDVSPQMVQLLETNVARRGVGNIETRLMSAYKLEVEDGTLDGIFCANALHVMETPRVALREFHRALRPGGLLAVPTFCHAANARARLLSWAMSLVSPFVAHTKFTPLSLQRMVAESGFAVRAPLVFPGKFPLAYLVADRAKQGAGEGLADGEATRL